MLHNQVKACTAIDDSFPLTKLQQRAQPGDATTNGREFKAGGTGTAR